MKSVWTWCSHGYQIMICVSGVLSASIARALLRYWFICAQLAFKCNWIYLTFRKIGCRLGIITLLPQDAIFIPALYLKLIFVAEVLTLIKNSNERFFKHTGMNLPQVGAVSDSPSQTVLCSLQKGAWLAVWLPSSLFFVPEPAVHWSNEGCRVSFWRSGNRGEASCLWLNVMTLLCASLPSHQDFSFFWKAPMLPALLSAMCCQSCSPHICLMLTLPCES